MKKFLFTTIFFLCLITVFAKDKGELKKTHKQNDVKKSERTDVINRAGNLKLPPIYDDTIYEIFMDKNNKVIAVEETDSDGKVNNSEDIVILTDKKVRSGNPFGRVIKPAHRVLEFGTTTDFGFANNYFAVKDILVKDLVVDFRKMADDMPKDGLNVDALLFSNFFMNINLEKFNKIGFQFGINTGIESYFRQNTGKNLFDFIGKGNELNEKFELNSYVYSDVFAYVNFDIGFRIFNFYLKVGPSLFTPIVHAKSEVSEMYFLNDEEGNNKAKFSTDLLMYTPFDISSTVSSIKDKQIEINKDAFSESIKSGWGFDLAFSLEHKIFYTLDGMIYGRMPIVPATLNHLSKITLSGDYEIKNLISIFSDGGGSSADFSISDVKYEDANCKVNRPFRMGTEVAWRPFGNWLVFGAGIGFGVKNPFFNDAQAFLEYKLAVDFDIYIRKWNILSVMVTSDYESEMFKHRIGLMLNLRVLEIQAGVYASGGDFMSSFRGAGAGLYLGAVIGL